VDYVGKTADALTIENDNLAGLGPLLSSALGNACAASRPGATWYVAAPTGPQFLEFAKVLSELGIWRQSLVWIKNSMVLGHSDFHYRHEALFYGWKPGAVHRSPPNRTYDSVWEFDRPSRSADHPTMKPVELVVHALLMSSQRGSIVLDPFAGSGTTLVAAQGTGRIGCAVELEPKYCAVILERMEALGVTPEVRDV
jgi:site-specific DNA-methyltransferase (adenine-specific)